MDSGHRDARRLTALTASLAPLLWLAGTRDAQACGNAMIGGLVGHGIVSTVASVLALGLLIGAPIAAVRLAGSADSPPSALRRLGRLSGVTLWAAGVGAIPLFLPGAGFTLAAVTHVVCFGLLLRRVGASRTPRRLVRACALPIVQVAASALLVMPLMVKADVVPNWLSAAPARAALAILVGALEIVLLARLARGRDPVKASIPQPEATETEPPQQDLAA